MKRLTFPFLFALATGLASCGGSTDPDPVSDRIYYLEARRTYDRGFDSAYAESAAVFRQTEGAVFIPAGNVEFNGDPLLPPDNGTNKYYDDSSRVNIEGAWNVWRIGGSDQVTPFIDSIRTPANRTRITFPNPGDTFNLDDDVTLRWETAATRDPTVRVGYVLTNVTAGRTGILKVDPIAPGNDDGEQLIWNSAEARDGLQPGTYALALVRAREEQRTGVDGATVILRIEDLDVIRIVLED